MEQGAESAPARPPPGRAKAASIRQAEREARAERLNLADGTTLNDLLLQILDSDPATTRTARVKTPLSPASIREIPFEWDSMVITLCIDQMTGADSLPALLMDGKYDQERKSLRAAVVPALNEDARGTVSPATRKRMVEAIAAFQRSFRRKSSEFEPGYEDARIFLTTLAGLSRLLNDPSLKTFLSKLDDGQERTVGDLVAFMNAFNLRFGPATSERQLSIYRRLAPALEQIRDQAVASHSTTSAPDRSGERLRAAAKDVFKDLSWEELEAHARETE